MVDSWDTHTWLATLNVDQLLSNHDNTDYQANLHEFLDHDNNCNEYKSFRYYFNNVPEFFMSSDSWKNGMIQLIDIFINSIQIQEELDNDYTKL